MLYGLVLALHVIVCLVLMLVVLMQSGKGGGLAGAFGAAGGQTGQMLFGGRGAATFLSKATTVLGGLFLVISLLLALMTAQRGEAQSVLRRGEAAPGTVAPAVDAPSPTDPAALEIPVPATGEAGQSSTPVPALGDAPASEGGEQPAAGEPETPPPGGGN